MLYVRIFTFGILWHLLVHKIILWQNAFQILNACVPLHQWKGVSWVFEQLRKSGLRPNGATYGLAMEVLIIHDACTRAMVQASYFWSEAIKAIVLCQQHGHLNATVCVKFMCYLLWVIFLLKNADCLSFQALDVRQWSKCIKVGTVYLSLRYFQRSLNFRNVLSRTVLYLTVCRQRNLFICHYILCTLVEICFMLWSKDSISTANIVFPQVIFLFESYRRCLLKGNVAIWEVWFGPWVF